MDLIFVTSNNKKYKIAESILKGKNISLSRRSIQLDELQTDDLLQIANSSAIQAFNRIGSMVAVTDVGFYIPALKGFPGPFVKYINQYLSSENLVNLMSGVHDREVIIKECLVIVKSEFERDIYFSEFHGYLSEMPSTCDGTSFEKLFIPDGFSMPISDYSSVVQFEYWKKGSTWNKYLIN